MNGTGLCADLPWSRTPSPGTFGTLYDFFSTVLNCKPGTEKERKFICQTNLTLHNTITITQWQAAREEIYAYQAGRP